MLEVLKVILLGLVEGITEWLPVSSTGHLILVDEFIKLAQSDNFIEVFTVVVQLGAILAVCVLYFCRLNPFQHRVGSNEFKKTISLWKKVLIACVPAGVLGVLLDDYLDQYLFKPVIVALALIVYGIAFIIIEKRPWKPKVKSIDEITNKDALKIGAFQILSLVPGTSRSGVTILGGLISGIDRTVTAEFSFFMAIPVMLGASFLKLLKGGLAFSGTEWVLLLLGVVVAFIVSLFTIKLLVNYIKKNSFIVFGWYRICLGIIVLCYFLLK